MKQALKQLIREFQESTGENLPILDKTLNAKDRAAAAQRERYRTDEEFRLSTIERAKRWNKKNRKRKRTNDAEWQKENGAAASRAYRQRKKAKQQEKNQ